MDDRKLLELAAKAAGIEHPGGEHCVNGPALWDCKALRWWRPLTDDGDALKLAVRLKVDIAIDEPAVHDLQAVTRRAIVRAAAEIGKAMP